MPRPNILLIHSDQHRYDCLGCHGHPVVQTPHLDRLATQGVSFSHAFTPNPVCSPERACLLTGAWATAHGCVTIPGTEAYRPADPALPVMTQLLADAGYSVGHVGKFHGETADPPQTYGVDTFIDMLDYRPWRMERGLPPRPSRHGWYGEIDEHITPDTSKLAWEAGRVIDLLDRYAADDSPFFLRWDPLEPHLPNIVPEPFASMYAIDAIEPWPSFPDPLRHKPPVQRRTRERWGTDTWKWKDWAPIVQRYLGEITLMDAQIGRVLDRLDALGLSQDTIVVYTTDHGDMCGAHGMMDKHYVMYDDILRVPLLISGPRIDAASDACDAMIIHALDLPLTFLRAADIEPPSSFVGIDLIDAIKGKQAREDVFSQYQGTHQGLYSQRMLRDRRWKYVYNPVCFDELYDLDTDHSELNNLIDDPDQAKQLQIMQTRMAQWMSEINDPLSAPTYVWDRERLPSDHPAFIAWGKSCL